MIFMQIHHTLLILTRNCLLHDILFRSFLFGNSFFSRIRGASFLEPNTGVGFQFYLQFATYLNWRVQDFLFLLPLHCYPLVEMFCFIILFAFIIVKYLPEVVFFACGCVVYFLLLSGFLIRLHSHVNVLMVLSVGPLICWSSWLPSGCIHSK